MTETVRLTDVDAATGRRALALIGLGVRGRNVVVGVEQVRMAARKGRLALAVIAPDAARNSLKKVVPMLAASGVRMVSGPGASALGSAVGRESTAAVGVTDAGLAKGLRELLDEYTVRPDVARPDGGRTPPASKGPRRHG
jgi:ribosomal protein L7Ae-like RNA K-turn-binding protein